MKILITLLLSFSTFAATVSCHDIDERSFKMNSEVTIRVDNIGESCIFSVQTSKDSRVSKHDGSKEDASRQWSFQSQGKINVQSSYAGPTDSSSTSYKSYQLFPNDKGLKLEKLENGSFSFSLPNGAEVFFNKDGSIDHSRTKDLKIKDTPIKLPDFKKNKSRSAYNKLESLSYRDPKKVSIRLHHRGIYSRLTSRSIGLETNIGMYIPLGVAMGKIPGNNANASFTLFGKDDEKLCKSKMPAHYFFNYIVKCSAIKPNSQCACKLSEEEIFDRINTNSSFESKIRQLKFRLLNLKNEDQINIATLELEMYQEKFDKNLYSKLFFSCNLDRKDANKFVSDKKYSNDHREIDGLNVKPAKDVLNKLIASGKCNKLKKMSKDCFDCAMKEIINVENIENQKRDIDKITDKIE